jgi:hypothetical protein
MGQASTGNHTGIKFEVHSAACFACRNIAGLQYDTAVSIVSGMPELPRWGNERFLQYVKDVFWSSPEWRALQNSEDDLSRRIQLNHAVAEACRSISGIDPKTAAEILSLIPDWTAMQPHYRISCVRTHWDRIKQSRKANPEQSCADFCEPLHSNSAYMSRAAREARRFNCRENIDAGDQPRKTVRSGAGRGDRIGDPCMFRTVLDSANKSDEWQPGWLRQWSTHDSEGHIYPVAIVESRETGNCFCAWVEDVTFE